MAEDGVPTAEEFYQALRVMLLTAAGLIGAIDKGICSGIAFATLGCVLRDVATQVGQLDAVKRVNGWLVAECRRRNQPFHDGYRPLPVTYLMPEDLTARPGGQEAAKVVTLHLDPASRANLN
jgi:hypothetical protein